MIKLKISFFDKTQRLNGEKTEKSQMVPKLKNSNCDNTQKLKLRQNSKTKILKKLKNQIVTKF